MFETLSVERVEQKENDEMFDSFSDKKEDKFSDKKVEDEDENVDLFPEKIVENLLSERVKMEGLFKDIYGALLFRCLWLLLFRVSLHI